MRSAPEPDAAAAGRPAPGGGAVIGARGGAGARPPRWTGARVLGIDPGSRITGYGVIDATPAGSRHVASGSIRVAGEGIAERLHSIVDALREVSDQYAPGELAIERVFVSRNAESALKLGQARGAALVAVPGLPVFEYAATRVKQAMTGSGRATKQQVQHMVRVLLSLPEVPRPDAADALAVALCHAHSRTTLGRMRPDQALPPP